MTGFGEGLHQCEPGDRLRFPAESQHLRDALLRVTQHGMDAQSPAIGKLQLVAILQPHDLNRMPADGRGKRQFPPGVKLVAIHRHVIMIRIKQEKGISHSFRAYQKPRHKLRHADICIMAPSCYSFHSLPVSNAPVRVAEW